MVNKSPKMVIKSSKSQKMITKCHLVAIFDQLMTIFDSYSATKEYYQTMNPTVGTKGRGKKIPPRVWAASLTFQKNAHVW